MKTVLNWLIFLIVCVGLYFAFTYFNWHRPAWHLSGGFVILVALSAAFTWVEKLKWGNTKPLNCTSCLTGWFSLTLAWLGHTEYWYFYLFIGLFVGAMWEGVKMRFL